MFARDLLAKFMTIFNSEKQKQTPANIIQVYLDN